MRIKKHGMVALCTKGKYNFLWFLLPLSLQLDLPYFFLFYFLFSTESLKSNFSKFGQQQFQLFLDVVDLMTYRRRL